MPLFSRSQKSPADLVKALKEGVNSLERGDKKAEKAQEEVSKNLVRRKLTNLLHRHRIFLTSFSVFVAFCGFFRKKVFDVSVKPLVIGIFCFFCLVLAIFGATDGWYPTPCFPSLPPHSPTFPRNSPFDNGMSAHRHRHPTRRSASHV